MSEEHSADPGVRPGRLDPRRPLEVETHLGVPDGFRFVAVGDCILSRPLSQLVETDPGLRAVTELLHRAQVAYGNFETSVVDLADPELAPYSWDADWTLASDRAVARDLTGLGIDIVSRANNHALDWGLEGMRATDRALDDAGVVHAGTGRHRGLALAPRYLERPEGRIALVSIATSYRPTSDALAARGAAPGRPGVGAVAVRTVHGLPAASYSALAALDPGARDGRADVLGATVEEAPHRSVRHEVDERDLADVLRNVRLAAQHSDFVVVALHAHQAQNEWEFGREPLRPAAFVSDLGRAAIDAGAAVFVTTGNHNVGGVELHRGRPILTGLGNFVWSDVQEPLSGELHEHRTNRALLGDVFDRPDRVTDADLTAAVNATGGFATPFTFQSIVAECVFTGGAGGRGGGASEIVLHPISLRYGARLTRSGIPEPAGPAEAREILAQVEEFSPSVRIEVVEAEHTYGRVHPA